MTLVIFDLLLRGGAITLAWAIASAMLLMRCRAAVTWAAVTAAFGISGYLINTAPDLKAWQPPPLILMFAACPAYVWWLVMEIFEAGPWPRRLVAPLALAFVSSYMLGQRWEAVLLGHAILAGALNLHMLFAAITGRADDLVEGRRRFRWWLVVAVGMIGLVITGFEVTSNTRALPMWLLPLQASVILALIAGIGVWFLYVAPGIIAPDVAPPEMPRDVLSPAESAVLDRLRAAMADCAWAEEGLTIGALAAQIDTSEHRLRKVINQGLGHRNFAQFVNGYRIRAAQVRLSDPSEADTSVLVLAHDVGFASLGPFNRAFRAETGESPSEYRARAVSGKASPITL